MYVPLTSVKCMFVCHFGLYFPVLFTCFSVNFSFVYDLPGIRLESVEISR